MTFREDQRDALPGRIVARAERLIDRGDDLFPARSVMASVAMFLFLDDHPDVRAVREEANAGIIQVLAERGAEGVVFADRVDLGNGPQDSTDFVLVTARRGIKTIRRPDIHGELVVRDATENAAL